MNEPKTKQLATVTERKNGMYPREASRKVPGTPSRKEMPMVLIPSRMGYVSFMLKNTIANDTATMKSHAIRVRLSNQEKTYMRAPTFCRNTSQIRVRKEGHFSCRSLDDRSGNDYQTWRRTRLNSKPRSASRIVPG